MTESELAYQLDILYKNPPTDLLIQIPAGTGICHIANVPPEDWKRDFVWINEGRWKPAGELKKHYGDFLPTCAQELFGGNPPNPAKTTCELWEAQNDFMALNILAFPANLQKAFYEDYGPAPHKWLKPNLAVKKFYEYPVSQGIKSIYAPSASGIALGMGGQVLVTHPDGVKLRLMETGSYDYYVKKQL